MITGSAKKKLLSLFVEHGADGIIAKGAEVMQHIKNSIVEHLDISPQSPLSMVNNFYKGRC